MQWLTKWLPSWRVLFWLAHALFVVLAVAVLALVNRMSGLDRLLITPAGWLDRVWLPLLFLLLYGLGWLAYGLWSLLGPERDAGEFDDVRDAWAEIRLALEAAGLRIDELPLFLVLGKPAGGVRAVFDAARLPLRVRLVSGPLAAFAGPDGVFICCPGASLSGLLTERLAADAPALPTDSELLNHSVPEPPVHPQLSAVLLLEPEVKAPAARRASLVREPAGFVQARRLRHVCRLLARDRRPLCPVNGVIALVPMAATADDDAAVEAAAALRQDWAVAREALQLDCPRFVLLCDAQAEDGFAHLTRQFPEGQGPSRLLGQNFPLTPDVPASEVPGMFEGGLHWVRDAMLPTALARLLRREGEAGVADRDEAVRTNAEVYRYLLAMRGRIGRLARLVALSVPDHPPRVGGVYVAGTGVDEREQGFVTGVLRRAIEAQNAVSWTPEAVSDDAALHRAALLGYVGLAVFLALVAGGLLLVS